MINFYNYNYFEVLIIIITIKDKTLFKLIYVINNNY